jgi:hypothetical protein
MINVLLGLSIGFIYAIILYFIKARDRSIGLNIILISSILTLLTCGYGISDYFIYTFLAQTKPSLLILLNGFIIAIPIYLSTVSILILDKKSRLFMASLGLFLLNLISFSGFGLSLPGIIYLLFKSELFTAITQNLLLLGMYIPLLFLVSNSKDKKN